VIAVAAVDEERRPASFSTRGDHVSVAAPGERLPGVAVGGYSSFSGTSFAAPLVTGACALLLSRAARHAAPLDPLALRRLLMTSAAPFATDADARGCGAGILDLPAALAAVDQLSHRFLDEPSMGLLANQGGRP
jgi:subtilisin family serine protease